jgi:hypothetical protein
MLLRQVLGMIKGFWLSLGGSLKDRLSTLFGLIGFLGLGFQLLASTDLASLSSVGKFMEAIALLGVGKLTGTQPNDISKAQEH